MYNLWKQTKRIMAGLLILIIVLMALTYAAGEIAKRNLLEKYPAPGQLINVGEFRMHIHCIEEGNPTVILAAGLDDFSIFWLQVQPKIAKVTRVCSYDRAGLGWCEASPSPRTSGNMVKELHGLLINAGIDGPNVMVGHSFGGALTRLYAHQYPSEVEAMILVHDVPLVVISRGYWDAMPGFSVVENRQAWQMWQEMQAELLSLSSNSRWAIATESEHHVQIQQPELVINAILEIVRINR